MAFSPTEWLETVPHSRNTDFSALFDPIMGQTFSSAVTFVRTALTKTINVAIHSAKLLLKGVSFVVNGVCKVLSYVTLHRKLVELLSKYKWGTMSLRASAILRRALCITGILASGK